MGVSDIKETIRNTQSLIRKSERLLEKMGRDGGLARQIEETRQMLEKSEHYLEKIRLVQQHLWGQPTRQLRALSQAEKGDHERS